MDIEDKGIAKDLESIPCSGNEGRCLMSVVLVTRWGKHTEPSNHAYASFCADHLKQAEKYIKTRRLAQ